MALLPKPAAAQTDCGWNPDFEQDYAIGITDILAILGIFGAVDNDQDGLWDVNDLCEDTEACNYDANPTEACLYEDALGVCGGEGVFPELLIGSWQFSGVAGAISVGPDPYSDEWYSSPANGLQNAQYDDVYLPPGWIVDDRLQRSIIDALGGTRVAYGCTSPPRNSFPTEELRRRRHCIAHGTGNAHVHSSGPTTGLVYDIDAQRDHPGPTCPGDDANCNAAGCFHLHLHPHFRRPGDGDGEGYPAADVRRHDLGVVG